MTFNEYQKQAIQTAVYPDIHSIYYPALGLAGEAGEVADKVKKILRGDQLSLPAHKKEIGKELGDVLWYCAALAHDLGFSLEDIASQNIEKLSKRMQEGTIKGSGDNR